VGIEDVTDLEAPLPDSRHNTLELASRADNHRLVVFLIPGQPAVRAERPHSELESLQYRLSDIYLTMNTEY